MRIERNLTGELRRHGIAIGKDMTNVTRGKPEAYNQRNKQEADKQNGKRE
jgi:hypothetical protein